MNCNWSVKKLGDLVKFTSGGTPSKSNEAYWGGDIPWISASSMDSTRYSESDLKVTTEGSKNGTRLVPKDTVLLLVRGGALHNKIPVGITTREVTFNQDVKALVPKTDEITPWYLLFWLISIKKTLLAKVENTGIGAGKLDTKILQELEVPLPPQSELKRLEKFCKALDDKIILNTDTNQTLEAMAQAIFKSWFVDFDPVKAKMNGEQPEGMDETTASLFPEKLVESELGLIPEGWPVDLVGNHIELTKGKSYKSSELQESTTALVTLKSFKRGGGYRMDGLKEYTGTYKPKQVIEAGDLVMSLTDVTQAAEIVGKPALVIEAPQYDTLVASLDVAILRPKTTDAKQYFYGLMSTYRFHRYAESFATGTTVLHLSPKGITTFEFACPSAELVKKYHEFSAPIFAKIEANILESQELAKLRDTLLPKLLSGEIELRATEVMEPQS
ncbi:TPA: restriction endonuclease subunit S [Photobacterium damselae]